MIIWIIEATDFQHAHSHLVVDMSAGNHKEGGAVVANPERVLVQATHTSPCSMHGVDGAKDLQNKHSRECKEG